LSKENQGKASCSRRSRCGVSEAVEERNFGAEMKDSEEAIEEADVAVKSRVAPGNAK
jgi:hypothetical protein